MNCCLYHSSSEIVNTQKQKTIFRVNYQFFQYFLQLGLFSITKKRRQKWRHFSFFNFQQLTALFVTRNFRNRFTLVMPPLPDPNVVISLFKLSGRNFYFFSKWEANEFELHITDGKHVWFGKGTI
jgi:hypothetical protein